MRWMEFSEAIQIWRTAQAYWEPGSPEWADGAKAMGEVAVATLGTTAPSGRSWDELSPLLEVGIQGGHAPSFLQRLIAYHVDVVSEDVAERTRQRDLLTVEMSRKLLERDPGNVLFLEEEARLRLRNEALWTALMVDMMFYRDKTGAPTRLLEYIRKTAPRDGAGKQNLLQPADPRFMFGRTGQRLLKAAREDRDPLAASALLDLGLKEKNWDRILTSR